MASNMLFLSFSPPGFLPFVLPPAATDEYRSHGSDLEDILPFFRVDLTELCDR